MTKQKKLGKFFLLGPTWRGGIHALELQDPQDFIVPGHVLLGPPDIGGRGFGSYPRVPELKPDKEYYDRPPKDLEQYDDYWLVSERLKDVMQAIDPEAAEFVECNVYHISGKLIEPKHYLCDVVRVLDAVDEEASDMRIKFDEGRKIYSLLGTNNIVFDEHKVKGAHLFRNDHMVSVICDRVFREACVAAGIKEPLLFQDVSAL